MERWDSMGVLGLICRLYSERETEEEEEVKIETPGHSDEPQKDDKTVQDGAKKCSCNTTNVIPSQHEQNVTLLDKDENEDNETDLNFLLD